MILISGSDADEQYRGFLGYQERNAARTHTALASGAHDTNCRFSIGLLKKHHLKVSLSILAFFYLEKAGLGFLATVIGVFCYSGLVRGFFATVLTGEGFLRQFHGFFLRRCRLAGGFLQQSHGVFLRRCRLAGGFLHQSHGGFLHQFSRPDKATLKQQKLQLENFGFSVFPHIPRRIKKLVLVAVVLLP